MHAIASDWRSADLDAVDSALCEYAVELTTRQEGMDAGRIEALRVVGLDDRAIHDATQIIGYFNYITRVADGLGVEPETHVRPWGDTRPAT